MDHSSYSMLYMILCAKSCSCLSAFLDVDSSETVYGNGENTSANY
jgi:hypothetical protein